MNRAQAEGIMAAMAEVIDESIRNMTSKMVTKADQEKVLVPLSRLHIRRLTPVVCTAPLHTAGRLRAAQVGAAADREERARDGQGRERPARVRHRETAAAPPDGHLNRAGGRAPGPQPREGSHARREQ